MTSGPRRIWRWLSLGLVLVAAAIFLPGLVAQWKLKREYLDHLFIVQHDFVYQATVQVNGKRTSIYLVKNADNQFDTWDPGQTVNRISAAALMLGADGDCITSRYATEPWRNDADVSAIKSLLSQQTNITEDTIVVSGRTIRLTAQSAQRAAQSADNLIEYQVVGGDGDGREIRYIGRKNRASPLPVKEIPLGVTYLNNLEQGKTLYALAFPNIDFSSGLPFETRIEKFKVDRREDNGDSTRFQARDVWLPEGAPVFDEDLNLVGVFTSSNVRNEPNYISSFLRHFSSDMPENVRRALDAGLQQTVESIPDVPVVEESDSGSPEN